LFDFPGDLRLSRQDQFQESWLNAYYGGVVYPTDGTLQPAEMHSWALPNSSPTSGCIMLGHTLWFEVLLKQGIPEVQFDGGHVNADVSELLHEWYTGNELANSNVVYSYSLARLIATEELLPEYSFVRQSDYAPMAARSDWWRIIDFARWYVYCLRPSIWEVINLSCMFKYLQDFIDPYVSSGGGGAFF